MVDWFIRLLESMSQFRSFEEMDVWQEARKIVHAVRAICKRETVRRDYAFVDQITRSTRSIAANIAEGCESMTIPEFITFLGHAKRSSGEVRSHLYDALDEAYISQTEFDELAEQTKKICRMVAKLIHHLQSLNQKYKRTFAVSKPPINQLTNKPVNQ